MSRVDRSKLPVPGPPLPFAFPQITRAGLDNGLELRVISPDGSEQVETFTESSDLTRRQLAFESDLESDGWTGPHGWNL